MLEEKEEGEQHWEFEEVGMGMDTVGARKLRKHLAWKVLVLVQLVFF